MTFAKLFHKSNSSIHQLQGNVLEGTIEQIHGTKVLVDTGMRSSFVCFRNELSADLFPTGSFAHQSSAFGPSGLFWGPDGTIVSRPESARILIRTSLRPKGALTKEVYRPIRGPEARSEQSAPPSGPHCRSRPVRIQGPLIWRSFHLHQQINLGENFWASLLAALWRRRIPSALHDNYFNSFTAWGDYRLAWQRGRRKSPASFVGAFVRPSSRPSGWKDLKDGGQEEPAQTFGATPASFGGAKQSKSVGGDSCFPRSFMARCVIGLEEKRSAITGEFMCIAPKSLENISKRKLVWTELSNLWRISAKNRMKTEARSAKKGSRLLSGFILNSVNGGYAIAIAGYIAFLPKSLCINKRVFLGQWRQFAILSMNPKISNIVVKEIKAPFGIVRNKPWSRRGTARDRHKGPKTGPTKGALDGGFYGPASPPIGGGRASATSVPSQRTPEGRFFKALQAPRSAAGDPGCELVLRVRRTQRGSAPKGEQTGLKGPTRAL